MNLLSDSGNDVLISYKAKIFTSVFDLIPFLSSGTSSHHFLYKIFNFFLCRLLSYNL